VKRTGLGIFIGLLAAVAGVQADSSPLSATNVVFQEAKSKYYAHLSDIQRRSAEEISQLPEKYRKSLVALENELQKQGDLQGVVAVRNEKTQFDIDKTLPEKDEPDLAPSIAGLREKYRQQRKQTEDRCNTVILELMQKYAKYLHGMEKQLTQDGQIQEALEIHGERSFITNSVEVLSEAIRFANQPAPADKKPTRPKDTPVSVPAAATGSCDKINTLLDATIVPLFSFEDSSDNARQIKAFNSFIAAVSEKGIKVSIVASQLDIESVVTERGCPQYRVRYRFHAGDYSKRTRHYALTEPSARSILQALCASFGLGYKIDPVDEAIVIVDKAAPGVEWTAADAPVDRIVHDMQQESGRKQWTGKPIVVRADVAGTMQGMAEVTIKLNNKVQLRLPKNSVNLAKFAEIQDQYFNANKENRDNSYEQHYVEVTVLGEIGKSAGPYLLTLEKCLILDCFAGTRYPNREAAPDRKIIRLGEPR
jgi:hypothetical protein